jgi:2-oxoglutarate dehydrogenase E1 component
MTEQTPNAAFHASSFLQGTNADYVDQLAAAHAADPASVDAQWGEFFRLLGDSGLESKRAAAGASWARSDWPPQPNDDLTAALTGEWPEGTKTTARKITEKAADKGVILNDAQIKRAVLDSVRAIMLIRAYRIRGHLAADLDPLGMTERGSHPELDPASYGFAEADMDRPVFIDMVLGLEMASMRQIVEIVKRT